jgi:flagellar hook assembly protein FlgD
MPDPSTGYRGRDPRLPAGRALARGLSLVAALCMVIVGSAAVGLTPAAEAARSANVPRKAVVVVGPVGSQTSTWLERGEAAAKAAERNGMQVVRLFHPYATWAKVVAAANGADLFVYLGHGNGWPSPYGPFQENTKNGVGLNPTAGEKDAHKVLYMGANRIIESIRFAPNAIVILNKLCYAAGNGEDHHAVPGRSVAVERVDNYAAGFLAAGARTVFAVTWQPAGNIIDALHSQQGTMDDLFRLRFGTASGSTRPYFGWVGWRPNLYFDSVRTPGARLHLDPEPTSGYLRAVSGDLGMTAAAWRGSGGGTPDAPKDTTAPELSGVTARQASDTQVASDAAPAVFTPNGDGLSETLVLRHTLSERASLKVEITRASTDTVVRRITRWHAAGGSKTTWDGRKDDGKRAPDGKYRIRLTPTDDAGNVGESVTIVARSLTALTAPTVDPFHFDPTDGDELSATALFSARLTKAATLGWRILDRSGNVVRRGPSGQSAAAGTATFAWDGTDDSGALVPRGVYTASVSATTGHGTYAHTTQVKAMPFVMEASRWTLKRGETSRLIVDAAEPVAGKPTIIVKQPGKDPRQLTVRRVSETRFKASLTAQPGGRVGRIRVKVTSTDTAGGSQSQTFSLQLR